MVLSGKGYSSSTVSIYICEIRSNLVKAIMVIVGTGKGEGDPETRGYRVRRHVTFA